MRTGRIVEEVEGDIGSRMTIDRPPTNFRDNFFYPAIPKP